MSKVAKLKAPFPYFGGKSRIAGDVWRRFGEVKNYVEPFCGSAAMLLANPAPAPIETINDADGFVANFWRAVAWAPEEVAYWADWPVNEADLEARHAWLVNRAERLRWSLEDPDYYDAKIAGWWLWGSCAWIGSGWCGGKGPHVGDGAHIRKLPHLSNAGRGVNRQLPHLSNAGQGVNRQLPHLGNAGRSEFIAAWMGKLSDRLRDVRVACGDWRRVTSASVTSRRGLTAIFLDPPYEKGAMDYAAGGVGSGISQEVAAWAIEAGKDPMMRIALCGHEGEHDFEAEGWAAVAWRGKGYGSTPEAKKNARSERIWFSPHCLPAEVEAVNRYGGEQ